MNEEMVKRWFLTREGDSVLESILMEGIQSLPERIDSIARLIELRDRKEIKESTHSLKGMSGNIGMLEIHEIAKKMDATAGKEISDFSILIDWLEDLKKLVDSIPHKYLKKSEIKSEPKEENYVDFNILLAEDDLLNQRLISALLNRIGIDCHIAENGKIAMDMLKNEHYDLLLLDMHMPVMDGMETITQIRSDPDLKDLYVIALTASSLSEGADKIIEAGCNAYLQKPIDITDFDEMILTLIEKLNIEGNGDRKLVT